MYFFVIPAYMLPKPCLIRNTHFLRIYHILCIVDAGAGAVPDHPQLFDVADTKCIKITKKSNLFGKNWKELYYYTLGSFISSVTIEKLPLSVWVNYKWHDTIQKRDIIGQIIIYYIIPVKSRWSIKSKSMS